MFDLGSRLDLFREAFSQEPFLITGKEYYGLYRGSIGEDLGDFCWIARLVIYIFRLNICLYLLIKKLSMIIFSAD